MLKLKMSLMAALVVAEFMVVVPQAGAAGILDAMAKAYENNPDINAARAGLRATDEGVAIAKAGWRPQISAFGQKTINKYDVNLHGETTSQFGQKIDDTRNFNSLQMGLTITQQVFDGFQTLNNVRAAESDVFSKRAQLKATEIQILLSAAQAYANIARDQQIVAIRKQNIAFLREQVNAANARLKVGEGTTTDLGLADAELAAAHANLAQAESQLLQSRAVYVQIVGEQPTGIKQAKAVGNKLPKTIETAVETGWREHPSILATMYSVDAAGYQVKSAEGAMLPGVVVQGQMTTNTGNSPYSSLNDYNTSTITARLNVPIYQGGAEYGQIRQAKERLGQQRIMLDSVRLEVQRTIVSGLAQYEASQSMIAANRMQVTASNRALQGVVEERKVGQATTLDVLDSQARVLQAEESLASSQRDAVVSSFAVVASMGRLTVDEFNLKVKKYNPEEHYEAVKDKWIGLRTVDGR